MPLFLIWMMIFMFHAGSSEDLVKPFKDVMLAVEGDTVTLSCNYSGSVNSLYWYQQKSSSSPQFLIREGSEKTEKLSVSHDRDRKEFHLQIFSAAVTDSAVYYCALQPTVTGNTKTLYKNLWILAKFCPVLCPLGPSILGNLQVTTPAVSPCAGLLKSPFSTLGSMNSIKPERSEERVEEGRNINLTCKYEGAISNIQWYRQYQRSRPEFLLYITEGGIIHPTNSEFSADINKADKRVDLNIISAAVTDSAVYYCA
ncbi:uncharacterized protein LOC115577879, partial [Sparus aurata]|uniref:uncharacterized protein LOC115577879 n=1 Tax=Sparus aurata TaxID=8175 RepID=UPI0011C1C377